MIINNNKKCDNNKNIKTKKIQNSARFRTFSKIKMRKFVKIFCQENAPTAIFVN